MIVEEDEHVVGVGIDYIGSDGVVEFAYGARGSDEVG